jgi:hypothetical protein
VQARLPVGGPVDEVVVGRVVVVVGGRLVTGGVVVAGGRVVVGGVVLVPPKFTSAQK